MDNSNPSGSNLNNYYSTMDAHQSFAGVQDASKYSHPQRYQQAMGVAALTPPSMPDSPPAQSPSEMMHNYPASSTRYLQPTPPPEIAQAAQQPFLPLDRSRDDDGFASFEARRRNQYATPTVPVAQHHPQLSRSPPYTPRRQAALVATHSAQCQPPAFKAPKNRRGPLSPSLGPMHVRSARMMMPPPPPRTSYTHHKAPSSNSPPSSKTDLGTNTDPSFRTHYSLPKWEHPIAMTRADCSIAHGNVASPTPMVGLPFGSTIELANHYR